MNARFVAVTVPKFSHYLPLAPKKDRKNFFDDKNFHSLCEKLFGIVSCFAKYSSEIPPAEYKSAKKSEMVVTQVCICINDIT